MANMKVKVRSNVVESEPQRLPESAPSTTTSAHGEVVSPAKETTMEFPDPRDADPTAPDVDVPSSKDHLLNDHYFRVNNKRRFLMDGLCRALGVDMYLLEVDKFWAPNPLGRGADQPVRYTREFPTLYIMFDKFGLMPEAPLLELKRTLAHKHGYKYIYETPEVILTHEELTKQLDVQKHIQPPKVCY